MACAGSLGLIILALILALSLTLTPWNRDYYEITFQVVSLHPVPPHLGAALQHPQGLLNFLVTLCFTSGACRVLPDVSACLTCLSP